MIWVFLSLLLEKALLTTRGSSTGVVGTALGDGLQMWTVRLNLLLFLELFLTENVNVLSFILAAECSAS